MERTKRRRERTEEKTRKEKSEEYNKEPDMKMDDKGNRREDCEENTIRKRKKRWSKPKKRKLLPPFDSFPGPWNKKSINMPKVEESHMSEFLYRRIRTDRKTFACLDNRKAARNTVMPKKKEKKNVKRLLDSS